MRRGFRHLTAASLLLASMAAPALAQSPVGTDFTYQGKLRLSGAAVNGPADLQFRLFDSSTGGTQIGSTQSFNNVSVVDGLFTAGIDFGAGAFNGDARHLEIAVRSPAGTGNLIVLNPRQPITATPYALQTRGLYVDGSNQVGMGTASPQRSLHVAAPESILRLQSTSNNTYSITEYQTDARVWHTGVGGSAVGNPLSGAYYIFDVNAGQARLVVDGQGHVGIGTLDPWSPLHVKADWGPLIRSECNQGYAIIASTGGSQSTAVNVLNSAATGTAIGLSAACNSTEGFALRAIANADSGVNYAVYGSSRSSSGYDFFAAGAGINYGSTSSRRWKRNLEPIADPLGKLALIRGVYFDWDAEHGGHHDVGMIAEEVGAVLPEVVAYEENGIDASGMDYSKLTPLLVEAVKGQQGQIEEQQGQIEDLRQVNSGLRGQVASQGQELAELREQLAKLMNQVAAMGQEPR